METRCSEAVVCGGSASLGRLCLLCCNISSTVQKNKCDNSISVIET